MRVHKSAAIRALLVLFALCASGRAGVLPDDRADALYHRYDGGGIQIQGPSILLRKKLGESVADAQRRAYAGVEAIAWDSAFHRHDIGWRAIERERG